MARIAGRDVAANDIGIMTAGFVIFITSFLPWYSLIIFFSEIRFNGWNVGFGGWFPIILVITVASAAAARVFGNVGLPDRGSVSSSWLLAAVSALAALIIFVRWLTFEEGGVGAGPRYGIFLALTAAIAQTVFGVLAARASGAPMPGPPRR